MAKSKSRSSGGKRASGSRSRTGGSSATSQMTTDHDFIRQWAESRGAKPTCVRGTGGGGDTGMLRLDFPGYSGAESLQEISWDEWFEQFDDNNLALLYQETTKAGEPSNFNKLVSRDQTTAGPRRGNGGRKSTSPARSGSCQPGKSAGGTKRSGAASARSRGGGKSSETVSRKGSSARSSGGSRRGR